MTKHHPVQIRFENNKYHISLDLQHREGQRLNACITRHLISHTSGHWMPTTATPRTSTVDDVTTHHLSLLTLATTFFGRYTSAYFAGVLRARMECDPTDAIKRIGAVDDAVDYAYITQGFSRNIPFWVVYAPNRTKEELQAITPLPLWKKHASVHNVHEHCSPRLSVTRNKDELLHMQNAFLGAPSPHARLDSYVEEFVSNNASRPKHERPLLCLYSPFASYPSKGRDLEQLGNYYPRMLGGVLNL